MPRGVEYVLSFLEYDYVCEELGIGEMPYPVELVRHGKTMAERAELFEQARESLVGKGFADPDGIDGTLARLLSEVSSARHLVDVLAFDGGVVRAVAAHDGDHCLLVMIDAGEVIVRSIDLPLGTVLLSLFPETPAGPGQSFPVPLRAFLEIAEAESGEAPPDPFAMGQEDEATRILQRYGLSAMDAVRVCAIAEERVRGGQFGVSTRLPRRGTQSREGMVLSFFDTKSGRYLMINDGEWVSITPADANRIARRIEEAVAEAA
ncbi:ESX secretion-associated protein EspG [Sciscionella sediminilitoris]|uniref:ESX secretion-associated protein EspG n=1 Tax=Sciscionella sediminilitoris TaxID=1445613 RepID=UPI0012E0DFD9|nr:ESX secretion-associated protein EspG [Sciscionella sp. SE31]